MLNQRKRAFTSFAVVMVAAILGAWLGSATEAQAVACNEGPWGGACATYCTTIMNEEGCSPYPEWRCQLEDCTSPSQYPQSCWPSSGPTETTSCQHQSIVCLYSNCPCGDWNC